MRTWKFNYKTNLFNSGTEVKKHQDEILAFFEARYGGYDNFYLPSFELESKVVSAATTSITINQDATLLGFSKTAGVYGNIIYLCNRLYVGLETVSTLKYSIHSISNISGTSNVTLTITPAITIADFPAGSYIMKACKVNFLNDELTRAFDSPYTWASDIEFVEDISDSYSVTLP